MQQGDVVCKGLVYILVSLFPEEPSSHSLSVTSQGTCESHSVVECAESSLQTCDAFQTCINDGSCTIIIIILVSHNIAVCKAFLPKSLH